MKKKFDLRNTIYSYLKQLICCDRTKDSKEKEELYQKGCKILSEKITYLHYLQMVTEVENLKKLLLSEEQRVLFHMISKPSITSETELELFGNREQIIYNTDSLKVILKYIKKLANHPEKMTKIDQILLSALDNDLARTIADVMGFKE